MSSRERGRVVVTARQNAQQSAWKTQLTNEQYDQALVLGQLADLLASSNLSSKIAFKGGAIMQRLHNSPRLSADLDVVLRTGKPVEKKMLENILTSSNAPFLLYKPKILPVRQGLIVPLIECHARASVPPVVIRMSLNWSEKLISSPEMINVTNMDTHAQLRLPVVNRQERMAEKVRAFLERNADFSKDAFDLYFYYRNILENKLNPNLPSLIEQKLKSSKVKRWTERDNISAIFDTNCKYASSEWPGKTAWRGGVPPDWLDIETALEKIKEILPTQLNGLSESAREVL